jgi:tetratricopeptide (TPR) repeat protein
MYRRHFAPLRQDIVKLVLIGSDDTKALSEADVVVEQMFDSQPRVDYSIVPPDVTIYRFPLVIGTFIWPFASQDHVHNRSYPFLPSGPYPAELGDSYLNRLIDQVPVNEAFARYIDLDVAKHAHLDRLYEIHLAQQEQRDTACGISVTRLMEERFRSEPLFHTRGHPTKRIFDHIAKHVFGAMGIPDEEIHIAINGYHYSVFPWDELPIHPNVAAHYGLQYVTGSSAYRHMDEGRFTFEQNVRRYLNYEWNRDLHEGIYLAEGSGDPAVACVCLEKGIEVSPASDRGWRALGSSLLRLNRPAEARDSALRAMTIDPQNPENHYLLASALTATGDLGRAEETLRTAIRIHPFGAKCHLSLADVLSRTGRQHEAAEIAAAAVPLTAKNPHTYGLLGFILHRAGDLEGAEAAFRESLSRAPEVVSFREALNSVLSHKQRIAAGC